MFENILNGGKTAFLGLLFLWALCALLVIFILVCQAISSYFWERKQRKAAKKLIDKIEEFRKNIKDE